MLESAPWAVMDSELQFSPLRTQCFSHAETVDANPLYGSTASADNSSQVCDFVGADKSAHQQIEYAPKR